MSNKNSDTRLSKCH